MADLDAFLKSKAEKKKKKKKTGGVLDLGRMAETLEKAVQEEKADEEDEAEKAAAAEAFVSMRKPGDDSDWHEYVESNATDLGGLKVKDMDMEEMAEEEEEQRVQEEAAEAAKAEPRRTWNTGGAPEDDEADGAEENTEPAPPPPTTTTAAVEKSSYVPPAQRRAALGMGPNAGNPAFAPDLSNDELFPTLDVADQKAKEQEAELKKMEYNRSVKIGAGGPKSGAPTNAWGSGGAVQSGGEGAWTSVGPRGGSDGKYRPGMLKAMRGDPSPTAALPSGGAGSVPARVPSPQPPPTASPAPSSRPGAYVPPSRR